MQPQEVETKHAARISELQEQIASLKQRWPAHSTPPVLMQRLDELEDELAAELKLAVASE